MSAENLPLPVELGPPEIKVASLELRADDAPEIKAAIEIVLGAAGQILTSRMSTISRETGS